MDWKLEVVVVPVSDVDRAKHFYGEQVGFVIDVDRQMSDTFRVVQLTPPGSACSITLMSGMGEMAPGTLKGLQLVVPDVQAARDELLQRGVDVTPVRHIDNGAWQDGHGGPWNSFIFFSDPDGNSWAVQEKPT
jgi:catechol 2,3-dioxygenase-like lactoylglutathione lyase family enzyme